jgi:hypothetical protein
LGVQRSFRTRPGDQSPASLYLWMGFCPPPFRARSLSAKKNGDLFPVDISLGSFRAQNGSTLVAAVIRDMSERKLLENRQTILARLGEALSTPLELDARLQSAALILSEPLCDWVIIDLISDQGGARRVAVANNNPANVSILIRLKNEPPNHLQTDDVLRCIRDQKPILVSSMDWKQINLKYRSEPHDLKFKTPQRTRNSVIYAISAHRAGAATGGHHP